MELFAVFIFAVFSVYGLYYAGQAAFWWLKSISTQATIVGFQKRKSMGRALPIVTFHDRDDIAVKAGAVSIDRVGYMIGGASEGSVILIRYRKDDPKKVKVSGFFSFICGGALQIPLVSFLVSSSESLIVKEQYAFLLMFLAIIGTAWLVLRFIRLYY